MCNSEQTPKHCIENCWSIFARACAESQAQTFNAESVRGEDSIPQGLEDNSNVKLDVADLGPTDLLLMGHGWSIPVHRYGMTLGFGLKYGLNYSPFL